MTDERDPKVTRRYRELGAEEPSRELDQAILAAAHRAADRPHAPLVTPAGRHRWYFAFGAAAILVLAVAVTVQVERQQPDPEALPASSAPARTDRAEGLFNRQEEAKESKRAEVEKQARAPSAKADSTDSIGLRQRDLGEASRVEAPPAPAAPAAAQKPEQSAAAADLPSPPPSAAAEADRRMRSSIQHREAQPAPAPQAAPAPPASILQGSVAASSAAVTPERLLEVIAELRKDGRHDEADKLLAEFRQRYPDYRISEEMLRKVERKK